MAERKLALGRDNLYFYLLEWPSPAYNTDTRATMIFNTEPRLEKDPNRELASLESQIEMKKDEKDELGGKEQNELRNYERERNRAMEDRDRKRSNCFDYHPDGVFTKNKRRAECIESRMEEGAREWKRIGKNMTQVRKYYRQKIDVIKAQLDVLYEKRNEARKQLKEISN